MSTFHYKAINESGTTITGNIEADTEDEAAGLLVEQGYIPARITEKKDLSWFSWKGLSLKFARSKPRELILFTTDPAPEGPVLITP